jgi:hypothetical protein
MSSNRQAPLVLLVLAAIAAGIVAVLPKTPSTGTKPEAKKGSETLLASSAASDDEAIAGVGPLRPLWDFVGQVPARSQDSLFLNLFLNDILNRFGRETGQSISKHYQWPCLKDFDVKFLLCTVPDPIDSGFGSAFDQVTEAIQRAAETQQYVVDRAWLPWELSRKSTTARHQGYLQHEREPGLVLFRAPPLEVNGATRLLVLLLVGETPSSGIHRIAFDNAVLLIEDYLGQAKEKPKDVGLQVVGPFYSGSEGSLSAALKQAQKKVRSWGPCGTKPTTPIKVVCGSASGFDRDRFVKRWATPDPGAEPAFETTNLPESVIRRWIYKFLHRPEDPEHGEQPETVALLVEGNTGFGRTVGRTVSERSTGGRVAVVPFPLHISQVRASYTKEQLTRLESSGVLPSSGRNLPFPEDGGDDSEKVREVVPVQAPLMTATRNDLLMSNFVGAMAERRARYVGIIATDIRDLVFLAQFIRRRHPDVQLFTTSADLLLTHPDYGYELRGMILGSPYPLYPVAQRWSAMDGGLTVHRTVFSSSGVEGYYNAVLVQLARGQTGRSRMADYGWAGSFSKETSPPIWISVVGQNGQIVPVYHVPADKVRMELLAHQDSDVEKRELKYTHRRPEGPMFSVGRFWLPGDWFLLFLGSLVAVGWLLLYAYRDCFLRCEWNKGRKDWICAGKMRIDFALACLPVMLMYGAIARMIWIAIDARFAFRREQDQGWLKVFQDDSGLWAGLLTMFLSLLAALVARRAVHLVYFHHKRKNTSPTWGLLAFIGLDAFVVALSVVALSLLGMTWMVPLSSGWTALVLGVTVVIVALGLCLIAGPTERLFSFLGFLLDNGKSRKRGICSRLARASQAVWRVARYRLPVALEALCLDGLVVGACALLWWCLAPWPLEWWETWGIVGLAGFLLGIVEAWLSLRRHSRSLSDQPSPGSAGVGMFALSTAVFAVLASWLGEVFFRTPDPQDVIQFERLIHISNGVSPLVPGFFIFACLFAWGIFLIKKMHLMNRFAVACPFPLKGHSAFKELHKLDRQIRREQVAPYLFRMHRAVALGIGLLLIAGLIKLWADWSPPLDGRPFGVLVIAGMLIGSTLVVITLCQFLLAWRAVKKLLRTISLLPMAGALDRLPEKVITVFGRYLYTVKPRRSHLTIAAQQFERVITTVHPFRKRLRAAAIGAVHAGELKSYSLTETMAAADNAFPQKMPDSLRQALKGLDVLKERNYEVTGSENEQMHMDVEKCVGVLCKLWPAHSMAEAFGSPVAAEGNGHNGTFLTLPEGDPIREWSMAAEDFVAIELIRYVAQFVAWLRNLLTSLTVGSLLLLLAASSYPFLPQNLLLVFLTTLATAVVVVMVWFLIDLNKDELVSRIGRSTPNRFTPDWGFLQAAGVYVLPILGGLMIQFPFFSGHLRSLLDPLLHVIR